MRSKRPNPFTDLEFVFSVAGTALLSPDEERALAEKIWVSRRRVHVAMTWSSLGRQRTEFPALKPHRNPLPSGLRKRLRSAEVEARALVQGQDSRKAGTTGLHAFLAGELAVIEESRETLLRQNLRLVAWIARGFQNKGLDLLDLFQEGAIALLWSIDRFDPARETRLSTFASYGVKLGIIRALAERGRTVRIPNYRLREVVETSSARSRLSQRLGREPVLAEIEREAGIPRASVEELIPAILPMASLDAPLPGSEVSLSERLVDGSSPTPFEITARSETTEVTRRALLRLSERERRIVTMRYGLDDDAERSYEDIGRTLGLSRERTRQLETSARRKLRSTLESGWH